MFMTLTQGPSLHNITSLVPTQLVTGEQDGSSRLKGGDPMGNESNWPRSYSGLISITPAPHRGWAGSHTNTAEVTTTFHQLHSTGNCMLGRNDVNKPICQNVDQYFLFHKGGESQTHLT